MSWFEVYLFVEMMSVWHVFSCLHQDVWQIAFYQPETHIIFNIHIEKYRQRRGRCCESGDLIQENVSLPRPERGDIIAVLTTGAYNYSMASNYNRVPRPPVVMIKDGVDYLAVKRESFDDLIRNDL